MNDVFFVNSLDCGKEGMKVDAHFRDVHVSKVLPEIVMLEVRKDGNDLIVMTKSRDEWADIGRLSEVVEEFKFVQDT